MYREGDGALTLGLQSPTKSKCERQTERRFACDMPQGWIVLISRSSCVWRLDVRWTFRAQARSAWLGRSKTTHRHVHRIKRRVTNAAAYGVFTESNRSRVASAGRKTQASPALTEANARGRASSPMTRSFRSSNPGILPLAFSSVDAPITIRRSAATESAQRKARYLPRRPPKTSVWTELSTTER